MISGQVTSGREAVVEVEVSGSNAALISAVIDTGFNGELTLSRDIVNSLSLQSAGDAQLTLADGQVVTLELYLASIVWHGRSRNVVAVQTEDEILIGMALLEGSRLTMDAWDGGDVVIEKVK